jgi:glutaredoxin-like protein NrdH
MTELDISYQYVDISEDMDALAHIVRLGHQQAPVVMTPTTSWSGYNPDKIATLVL